MAGTRDPRFPRLTVPPDFAQPTPPVISNRDLRGHEEAVSRVAITRDGNRIVSIDLGGELRVWDSVTGTCLKVLPTGSALHPPLALDQSGSRALALGTKDYPRRASVFWLDSEQPTITLEDDEIRCNKVGSAANGISAVAATPDWMLAATGSESAEATAPRYGAGYQKPQ